MAKPKLHESSLKTRTLSSLILLPASIALLIAGPPHSDGFIALVCILLLKEWIVLCVNSALKAIERFYWLSGGSLYILAGCGFFAALSHYDACILQMLLVLVATTTDTCAYFVGRWLKGPKLAPTISPGKTWSGAIGGIIGAQLILNGLFWIFSLLLDRYFPNHSTTTPLVFSIFVLFLSIVAECGDLLESWAKRHLGAKDSGALIPGHGGLLDRLDSLLPLAIIVGTVVVGWASL